MQVKTFEGFTMKDTVSKIRKEFGKDAVILQSSEELDPQSGQKKFLVKAAGTQSRIQGASADSSDYLLGSFETLMNRLDHIDKKLSYLEKKIPGDVKIQSIETSINELKILYQAHRKNNLSQSDRLIHQDYQIIYDDLILTDMDESIIYDMIKHIEEKVVFSEKIDRDKKNDLIKNEAIKYFYDRINVSGSKNIFNGQNKVEIFMGPNGAGKTTALIKYAAKLTQQKKCSVLFISYANKKIASDEQVKVFAKLMDIKHINAESIEELDKQITKNRHYDLILIDSNCGSPRVNDNILLLKEIKKSQYAIDTNLVLSMTDSKSYLNQCISKYLDVGIHSLIFSRLDESWTFGNIINIGFRWGVPLKCFSIGENVPEDFEYATRERVIERIFGI